MIVNEGLSLTIINETTNFLKRLFLKTIVFKNDFHENDRFENDHFLKNDFHEKTIVSFLVFSSSFS